jgi:ankyrin repeat domain-containing protein 50
VTWTYRATFDSADNGSESTTTSSHRGIRHLFSRKQRSDSNSNLRAEAIETFWPLDLLPNDCNDVRIMTWGYDSKVSQFFKGPTNRSNINAYARDLLYGLGNERLDCVGNVR